MEANPQGQLTKSDHKTLGSLILWLVVEEVCVLQPTTHVVMFSDDQATIHRVQKLVACITAGTMFTQALALYLKLKPFAYTAVHCRITKCYDRYTLPIIWLKPMVALSYY